MITLDGGPPSDVGVEPPAILSPVVRDFADPFVLHDGDKFHVYSTKGRGKNIPHSVSADLSSWDLAGESDALPKIGAWAETGNFVWAPSVLAVSKTRFVLFYAAKRAGSAPVGERGQMCIGRGIATTPDGPFVDERTTALTCQASGWSIDPSPVAASDGTLHLVWRQDVDDPSSASAMNTIYEQALDSSGGEFVSNSKPKEILRRTDGSWEDPIVENPAMIAVGAKYYLFYSGNLWRTANYAIGYAECAAPTGPCTKKSTAAPWEGSAKATALRGPGGNEIVRTIGGAPYQRSDGSYLFVMHGWIAPNIGYTSDPATTGVRALWLERLSFDTGAPVTSAP